MKLTNKQLRQIIKEELQRVLQEEEPMMSEDVFDYGLVCEILFYECKDYGVDYPTDNRIPYYIIEYKLLTSTNKSQYRYVSEENLKKVNE